MTVSPTFCYQSNSSECPLDTSAMMIPANASDVIKTVTAPEMTQKRQIRNAKVNLGSPREAFTGRNLMSQARAY